VINRPSSRPGTHEDNNEVACDWSPASSQRESSSGAGSPATDYPSKTKFFKTQPSRHEMTPSGPRWAALAQRCSDDVSSTCDLAPYKAETLTPFYNSDVLAGLPAVD
jgi:hypothetical protein